ncbi:unnamed protein product [Rotaria magnacalcarata]|uniref:Metalloprotease TIKI homolog n=2 Tax=Rotaria magnacalcarata TaxID=392030 RepID=A0A816QQF1_9BILA|nr:unnamed protein product [Rotaria magnacalcarata]
MLNKILQLVFFITISYMTCSCSYLWRIERSPPSYIFGTMHVSHERVWPYMSKEIRQAFSSSTHVYAEFNPTDDTYWDDFLQCIANRTRRVERSTDYPIRGALLDMYLIMEAHRSNKTTGSLETSEYFCEKKGMLASLKTWMFIVDKNQKSNENWNI